MRLHPFTLAVALLAAGCAEPAPEAPSAPATPTTPADTATEAPPEVVGSFTLPATMTDTLVVEGDPQPVTLHLVQVNEGAMPFATYIPPGMTHAASASGEGESHRFTMGDPATPYHASVTLFIPAEGSGLDDPQAYAQALAGEGVTVEPMGDAARWVQAGYAWSSGDRYTNVQAGTRGGRRFYIVEDMQQEMGDGFAPQAGAVLSHWLWLPDGTYLIDHF